MEKLKELRLMVRSVDEHFLGFLQRHPSIRCLVVGVKHWRDRYKSIMEDTGMLYEECRIFSAGKHDPWA
jgi:hypothetical protein